MIRTGDGAHIRAVMADAGIWPLVCDDGASPEDWQPAGGEHVHWVRSEDGGALFLTYPLNRTLWEVHIAVLPDFRDRTTGYIRDFAQYARENTQAACLLGFIPADNAPCLRAARAAGFKVTGSAPHSWRRLGRLIDMTIVTLEL